MNYVKAYADGRDVVYESADGRKVRFTGGDRNWRNTNPGNVRSNGIRWLGKIGEAGGFCVFATPEHGKRVVRKILANRAREGLTLAQAIARYAPACENDVAAYVRSVCLYSGVAADILLAGLDEVAMTRVMEGMFRHEGGRVGRVVAV